MTPLKWFTNLLRRLIIWYDEFKPKAEIYFKEHEFQNFFALCSILALCLCVGFHPATLNDVKSICRSHTSTALSTKRHLTEADLIEYFPNNSKLQSLFRLLGHRIEYPPPAQPLALVIAGRNLTGEELKFNVISTKHFWMENITIHADTEMSESMLFKDINRELEYSKGKAFVFINEIDKLSGRTPLVLQSLSDVDAAKYKETVYVLTLVDSEFSKDMNENECADMITRKLQKSWGRSLHNDQILPIISRITGITICLS